MYDYLIIGSGLFGSICAYELNKKKQKCLVIEKRSHIAGNCYTEEKETIHIHKYGAHIFHTPNKEIWNYINQFASFNNYVHHVKVKYSNKIYSFPINLTTLHQIYGTETPEQAKEKLNKIRVKIKNPKNLEEWALSQIGEELYEIFIKGYTKKQWAEDPKNLPTSIVKRLPIRSTYDDSYYGYQYQGIPIGGYTQIFNKLLEGIEIKTSCDYLEDKKTFDKIAKKIIYTGPIDSFFNYKFGKLSYRSLDFKTERIEIPDFQGNSVINYTESNIPYTRIIEHKHFDFKNTNFTYITKEYPAIHSNQAEPYYPINNEENNKIYKKYKEISDKQKNMFFGGRLAEYKYYDMHQVIASALHKLKTKIM